MSYVIFLIGLSVFMFPHISKVFFSTTNQISFNDYDNTISVMNEEDIKKEMEEIRRYNESLISVTETIVLPLEVEEDEFDKKVSVTEYIDPFIGGVKIEKSSVNSITKSGAFAYIKIPKINETLPIYLGATEEHLAKGVGQIDETSLPIGGLGTNSVIAGHRGYYKGAQIFKHLDKLKVGDRFYIHVFNQVLTYEVKGSEVILPNQTEKLDIDPDKDQVTLLTCTPYRVSTHRLLIYAERISEEQSFRKSYDGIQGSVDEMILSGVLSERATKSNEVSQTVRNDQLISYAIVIIGGILWVITLVLLIKSFKKPKDIRHEKIINK